MRRRRHDAGYHAGLLSGGPPEPLLVGGCATALLQINSQLSTLFIPLMRRRGEGEENIEH